MSVPPQPSTSGATFIPPSVEILSALLPQYEFHGLLGQGGVGAVYLARQISLDRMVAIKILPPLFEDQADEAARFLTEARAMAKLVHPHIVAGFDFGQTSEGHLFLAMEYVKGTDMHHAIRAGHMTADLAHQLIGQLCDALQYAHDNGIAHRDIKPANIMLTTDWQVKVADFGLAQNFKDGSAADDGLGTPDYAAPERFVAGAVVDHRADIYSLGVVIHEMLTGETPRQAAKRAGTNLPEAFIGPMSKCLMVDPSRRYQSAREVKAALALARHEEKRAAQPAPVHAVRVIRPRLMSRRSRMRSSGVVSSIAWAFACLLLVGGGAWFLLKNKNQPSEQELHTLAVSQLADLSSVDPELAAIKAEIESANHVPTGEAIDKQIASLNEKYAAALRREAATAPVADQVKMIEEAQRVEGSKVITFEADESALPNELKKLRGIYREQITLLETTHNNSVAAMKSALEERLQPLIESRQAVNDFAGAARAKALLENVPAPLKLHTS